MLPFPGAVVCGITIVGGGGARDADEVDGIGFEIGVNEEVEKYC